MERPKILAVDDEQSSLNAIYRTLRRDFDVLQSLNGQSALEVLKNEEVTVILADQRMPEMTGVELFQKAMDTQPDAMRILITGYTDVEATIDAINQTQIFYYIHKPWEPDYLRMTVRRAVEQHQLIKENRRLMQELEEANKKLEAENVLLHQEVEKQYSFDNIIGESQAMQNVFRMMKKVIPTSTTVLLLGETGTGKELIARAIHYNSPRQDKMFVAQNCGALPDTLLESELFGHVRGAFTGADSDKKGLFEVADGGTIFLDEIIDTSPAMQQRLLRVLQDGEVHPVGSEKSVKVDVRVLSAANRDLEQAIRKGEFRQDLYYRLNVFPIRVPPLRQRREDIPLLAEYFLEKYTRKLGKSNLKISAEALSVLMTSDFPGNVRQLENIIERAVTLADDQDELTTDLLTSDTSELTKQSGFEFDISENSSQSLKDITESMEKYYIEKALAKFQGNISRVAQRLGLSRVGLHKKMRRYSINPAGYKQR